MAMQRVTVRMMMSLLWVFYKKSDVVLVNLLINLELSSPNRRDDLPHPRRPPPPPMETHLLHFGAVVPVAHLAVGGQAVHRHEADGESQGADYHLPRVGSHQQAMEPEQPCQHGLRIPFKSICEGTPSHD